jgi:hypothetical protein
MIVPDKYMSRHWPMVQSYGQSKAAKRDMSPDGFALGPDLGGGDVRRLYASRCR